MKTIKISEDDFIEKYKPVQNHIDNNAAFNGWMYETYGNELDYIFELSKNSKRVWTIIGDDDDDDTLFYAAGFHLVNRLGFIVTENEYETGLEEVELDD